MLEDNCNKMVQITPPAPKSSSLRFLGRRSKCSEELAAVGDATIAGHGFYLGTAGMVGCGMLLLLAGGLVWTVAKNR